MQPWPEIEPDHPLIIGIAGGTGSGKTTIAHAVVNGVDQVGFIQHDSYYSHRSDLSYGERAAINYDHPDSLETALLIKHLEGLRNGEAVDVPVYDFSTHLRTDEVHHVEPQPVIVVEGILIFVEPALRDLFDLRLFVDTPPDLRLVRRIGRDIEERRRTIDSVLSQYLSTVRPMHQQFVEPSKRFAHIIIPEGYNQVAVGTVNSMLRDYLTGRSR